MYRTTHIVEVIYSPKGANYELWAKVEVLQDIKIFSVDCETGVQHCHETWIADDLLDLRLYDLDGDGDKYSENYDLDDKEWKEIQQLAIKEAKK